MDVFYKKVSKVTEVVRTKSKLLQPENFEIIP